MSVYLEVSTHCDDELYESGNNMMNQQNVMSLQSITSVSGEISLAKTIGNHENVRKYVRV